MPHSDRSEKQAKGWGGAVALFPLGLVFAGIAFLAIGASRTTPTPTPSAQTATSQQADASAADEAAAAAVIAISLARVAPPLPESALEPPAPQVKPPAEAARKPSPPREATAKPATPQSPRPANNASAQQAAKPQENAPPPPVEAKPAEEGFLARVGSYVPSPKKIAGAMSDGVSKIASYIPGL